MNPRVAPLLLCGSGPVPRAPGGEAAIVGGPQESFGDTGGRCLLRETPRCRKPRPPRRRVATGARFQLPAG